MKQLTSQQLQEKQKLESRFDSLIDRNLVASELGISNIMLHFKKNIIENDNIREAERLMKQLEEVDDSQEELRLKFKLDDLRRKRDKILKATDWMFISDVPVPAKHRGIYKTYRQYLRDVPNKFKRHPDATYVEPFDNWLRRTHPEEFLDGGDGNEMIYRFTYYLTYR